MREVNILTNPVAHPGVCGKCGSQNKDWFVDIGMDIDYNMKLEGSQLPNEEDLDNRLNIWLDGILYLCCDCINSLIVDVTRRFNDYLQEHDVRTYLNGTRADDSFSNNFSGETESNNSKFELSFTSGD